MSAVAADRVLRRIRPQFPATACDTMIFAAAVAAAPQTPANLLDRPDLAFLAATALEACHRGPGTKELAVLSLKVPESERELSFVNSEGLLARIDPVWAWTLFETQLGADRLIRNPLLGLILAAYLDEQTVRSLMTSKMEANPLFLRQLEADRAARSRLPASAIRERKLAQDLFASESNSYLAGAALEDAEEARSLALEMLRWHSPERLFPALEILGLAALQQGNRHMIMELTCQSDCISVQATWMEVAAVTGILRGSDLTNLLKHLSTRVSTELDPDRLLVAGLPLATAALFGNAAQFASLIASWGVTSSMLAERLFFTLVSSDVTLDDWVIALEIPDTSAADAGTRWWTSGHASPQERLQASRDVVSVGEGIQWRPQPGSLAEIIRFVPENAS